MLNINSINNTQFPYNNRMEFIYDKKSAKEIIKCDDLKYSCDASMRVKKKDTIKAKDDISGSRCNILY